MARLTRWGRELDPDAPLPEHPRPHLVRDTPWLNLNGRWQYAFAGESRPGRWDGEIVVPFSPEAPLSGVGRQLQPDEYLWYRRKFSWPLEERDPWVPEEARQRRLEGRLLLHFGAVDQSCTVWVNGTEVGAHTGGYLPFTLDVTDALRGDLEEVVVRVRDLSETGYHARGKQRLDAGRIWYTAQSGIWQTVWLESVPQTWITALDIAPDIAAGLFRVTAHLSAADGSPDVEPVETVVRPADPRLWTLEDPYLHEFEITVGDDTVRTYAGLREHGTETDAQGRRWFTLNGERIQHVGVLDQGYWPDGLMTPPSDAAMIHDIGAMKDLGFTVLRKHAKIEPLRWYHHCDRIGILVWQDMVNGGGRYRHLVTDLPARRPVRISDHRYGVFFRDDPAGRTEFRDEVRATIALLRNVAAIAVWTPFNEGWGQFDANDIAAEVSALDPTRLVNHVSGWIDQGGGDIKSYHSYLRPFRLRAHRREKRLHALTEYGGYSLRITGHASTEPSPDEWDGYRRCTTPDELAAAFVALHDDQIRPAVERGLAATVYTQLSDVEGELNGLFTWDRDVLKIPAEVVRAALARLRS